MNNKNISVGQCSTVWERKYENLALKKRIFEALNNRFECVFEENEKDIIKKCEVLRREISDIYKKISKTKEEIENITLKTARNRVVICDYTFEVLKEDSKRIRVKYRNNKYSITDENEIRKYYDEYKKRKKEIEVLKAKIEDLENEVKKELIELIIKKIEKTFEITLNDEEKKEISVLYLFHEEKYLKDVIEKQSKIILKHRKEKLREEEKKKLREKSLEELLKEFEQEKEKYADLRELVAKLEKDEKETQEIEFFIEEIKECGDKIEQLMISIVIKKMNIKVTDEEIKKFLFCKCIFLDFYDINKYTHECTEDDLNIIAEIEKRRIEEERRKIEEYYQRLINRKLAYEKDTAKDFEIVVENRKKYLKFFDVENNEEKKIRVANVCKTVGSALNYLNPFPRELSKYVIRQGDLYFLEVNELTGYEIDVDYILERERIKKNEVKREGGDYLDDGGVRTRVLYYAKNESIGNTNHIAEEYCVLQRRGTEIIHVPQGVKFKKYVGQMRFFVKGEIEHKQHKTLHLDSWHEVRAQKGSTLQFPFD